MFGKGLQRSLYSKLTIMIFEREFSKWAYSLNFTAVSITIINFIVIILHPSKVE